MHEDNNDGLKGFFRLRLNDAYFSDSWFSALKMDKEAMYEVVGYYGQVKMEHKGFCLATLEQLTKKKWTGGSHLVLNSTPIVPYYRPLMFIGYNYSYRKVLGFIANEGGGITEPGNPYLSGFPEIFLMFFLNPLFIINC